MKSFPNKFSTKSKSNVSNNILKAGYLLKRNRHGRQAYSNRYFKLFRKADVHNSPVLEYTHTKGETSKRKGSILLHGYKLVRTDRVKFKLVWKGASGRKNETRQFQAGEESQCNDWFDTIFSVLETYDRECTLEEKKDKGCAERRRTSVHIARQQTEHWSDDEDGSFNGLD